MTKALLGLVAVVTLTGCSPTINIKTSPLKEQAAPQIDADRKRCDEWSKRTAAPLAGFAACMVSAGYEVEPEVGSTAQTVRLTKVSTTPEPTRVLLDVLDCDAQARREAEKDLGSISIWVRENFNWYWRVNPDVRRQVFGECLRPRGYDLGKA